MHISVRKNLKTSASGFQPAFETASRLNNCLTEVDSGQFFGGPPAAVRLMVLVIVGIVLPLTHAEIACGQVDRRELGQRLQRFELAWETADSPRRAAAVPFMTAAVRSFFGLNLSAAGKQLDGAWQAVRDDSEVGSLEQAVGHYRLEISPFCADVNVTELTIKLAPFYDAGGPSSDNIMLHLMLRKHVDQPIVAEKSFPLKDAIAGCKWQTGDPGEGDYLLQAEYRFENQSFKMIDSIVSRIDRFEQRLLDVEKSFGDANPSIVDTVRFTLRDSAVLLRSMQSGKVQEIDYRAAERLAMCETLMKAEPGDAGASIAGLAQHSDLWLSLARGRNSVKVRLRAPANVTEPLPVLFLFHGAGGSENMFFETYGAGRVVTEGLQRGWLVIAPRQGLFGMPLDIAAMLDVLDGMFNIDRTRVMLIGHSMGAGQVVRQASRHPEIPVAAVALGGGNRVSNAKNLSSIRWFVGAGDQDFGRSGAQQLHNSLKAANSDSTYRDYVDVEHMVIVQAAINDVFQFLELKPQ